MTTGFYDEIATDWPTLDVAERDLTKLIKHYDDTVKQIRETKRILEELQSDLNSTVKQMFELDDYIIATKKDNK
jgi:septal ring factor EnvC (AmiA/AmiB activator)